jgi:two-component system, NtrC family, response regulator
MANILIIDDDRQMTDMLSNAVKLLGHDASCAFSLDEGFKGASSKVFDVIFLDVNLPDGDGLDILPGLQETQSKSEVIIITGSGTPDGAELAIRNGAWDYVEKPFSMKEIILQLTRALQYREEKKNRKPPVALKLDRIVGSSHRMRTCLDLIAQAAGSDTNVLITGETGTGKELFSWAIHHNSLRASHNFVVVDCAALPETLVESILFGYEKGAFTGADKTSEGLVKQADGGTLFLDEVGELPFSIQKAFLRVLQERSVRPLGRKEEIESNFRLIAATNRNLDQMVEEGQFRKDLLFRLRSMTIDLPPLRDHLEDIKELILYHMAKLCGNYGIGTKGFSPEFLETLSSYDWPGNVRELVYTLERAIAMAYDEPTLFPKHLPDPIRIQVARSSLNKGNPANSLPPQILPPLKTLEKLKEVRETAINQTEQRYLGELITLTQGNIVEACRISGLSRPRLYALLSKHKISKN